MRYAITVAVRCGPWVALYLLSLGTISVRISWTDGASLHLTGWYDALFSRRDGIRRCPECSQQWDESVCWECGFAEGETDATDPAVAPLAPQGTQR